MVPRAAQPKAAGSPRAGQARQDPVIGPTIRARIGWVLSWNQQFFDPIELPKGKKLVTPRDAANYIMKLPKAEHDAEEWQAAMEALLLVAESDGPTMFSRIGVMRALNRHVERVFDPSRKEKHWGRRKLARDRWLTPDLSAFDLDHWQTRFSCDTVRYLQLPHSGQHGQTYSNHQSLVRFGRYAETTGTCFLAGTFCETDKIIPYWERGQAICEGEAFRRNEGHSRHVEPSPARCNITALEINRWIEV
jgi:hypothetical protein